MVFCTTPSSSVQVRVWLNRNKHRFENDLKHLKNEVEKSVLVMEAAKQSHHKVHPVAVVEISITSRDQPQIEFAQLSLNYRCLKFFKHFEDSVSNPVHTSLNCQIDFYTYCAVNSLFPQNYLSEFDACFFLSFLSCGRDCY